MSSSNKNKSPLHEKKIPSKFLTRESSLSNPSFRVYYGKAAAGSVPFDWESQPGTPKHPCTTTPTTKLNQDAFPPLTPPPSYLYYSSSESIKKKSKSTTHNFLQIILPKLTLIIRRPNLTYRSNSSSSSCSSSEPSSPAVGYKTREMRAATARLSGPKIHFSSSEEGLHALMPCFGPRQ